MTTFALIAATAGTTGFAGMFVAEATGMDPVNLAALVVPLAGFSAWLVRWILQKQDERDKLSSSRDDRREEREEKRAEQSELQTNALQECVLELRTLNEQQAMHARAIAELPKRVVDQMAETYDAQRRAAR